MGQYWKVVNLDKKEYIDPHKLGCGLKLWEQLANHPGTGSALIVLCAAMPEVRGGGDFDLGENRHGPERTDYAASIENTSDEYFDIAKRTIGRWAGDRIALIGDYAEDSDLENSPIPVSEIYSLCSDLDTNDREDISQYDYWTDITYDVCCVLEHELRGTFIGSGWREFKFMDEN